MSVVAFAKKVLQAALFFEIWDAMKMTFKHMFHRPITFQYAANNGRSRRAQRCIGTVAI